MSVSPSPVVKRPGRLRRWVVRPLTWALTLLLVVLGSAALVLLSGSLTERARSFGVARLSEAVGRPVSLAGLEIGLFPLSLDFEELVVPGPTPLDPPFARLPRGRIELELSGLARPVLTIRRVWLEQPEVFLEVAADGRLNLPRFAAAKDGGGELVVRLGEVTIEQGVFRLNEISLPLDIEAQGVEVLGHGVSGAGSGGTSVESSAGLETRVSIERVETALPGRRPYPASLIGGVRVTQGLVEILDTTLRGQGLEAQTSGSYRFEGVEQRLALNLNAQGDMSLLAALGAISQGEVEGAFRYRGELFWNAGSWLLTGQVNAPEMVAAGHRFTELVAEVHGSGQELMFEVSRAGYAGGSFSGPVRVGLGGSPTLVVLELAVDGVLVRELLASFGPDLPMLNGRLRGAVRYELATSAPFDGVGAARLELYGAEPEPGVLPLQGNFDLSVAAGRLVAEALSFEAPEQRIELSKLGVELETGVGGFEYSVATEDAARLAAVLPVVAPGEPLPSWLPAAGRGSIQGQVSWGRGGEVIAAARLDLADVDLGGQYAGRLSGELDFSAAALERLELVLERGAASVRLSGRVPFDESDEVLNLRFVAREWPYELAQIYSPVELPLDGPLSGSLELLGPAEALSGSLDVVLAPATVATLSAHRLASRLSFDGEQVRFEELRLELQAGSLEGRGSLGLKGDQALDFVLESAALNLGLPPLATALGGHLGGEASLSSRWRGSLEAPRAELRLEVPALALEGRELGAALVNAKLEEGNLEIAADLPRLLKLEGGGRLTLPLSGESSNAENRRELDLVLAVRSDEIETLIEAATGSPLPGLTGSLAGRLRLGGALSAPEVGLELATLRGTYQGLALANLEPVAAHLSEDGVVLDSLFLGNQVEGDPAQGTELFLAGEVGLGEGLPLDLNLLGTLPARWLEPFLPNLRLSGTFNALGAIRGTVASPEFDGQADLKDSRLILAGFPHALDDLSAVALIYPEQVVIDRFEARLAGGAVRAAGSFALGSEPFSTYHFQAQARDFSLRYPEGWALEGSASLAFDPLADGSGSLISGRATLSRAAYQRELQANLFQLLQGYLKRQPVVMETVDTVLTRTQLAVEVDAPGTLRVNNNVADLRGAASLRVRGTLARPVLLGKVEVERGGTIAFDESEYVLERGLLTFSRLDRVDPEVDLVARTQVSEYEVTLKLAGYLERLTTSFSSEPPLPNLDVLALLATGDRPSTGGALTSPAGGDPLDGGSVESLLLGTVTGAVTDRVKKLLRFDKLRIDPTAATGGSVNAARLLVGKQISRDLYVTYQQSLSSSDQNLVQAEWRLAPGLVVVLSSVAEKGIDRQFAVDLRWETRF